MSDTDSHFPVETDVDHDTKLDTKAQVEKVPHRGPVGDQKEGEKQRHKMAQKKRFLDASVGEQAGWKSLPKSLIEAAKKVVVGDPSPDNVLLKAKVKDEGAPNYKCKEGEHPYLDNKKMGVKPHGR